MEFCLDLKRCTAGPTVTRSRTEAPENVFNFGLGCEHVFSKTRSVSTGYDTDDATFGPESDVDVTFDFKRLIRLPGLAPDIRGPAAKEACKT